MVFSLPSSIAHVLRLQGKPRFLVKPPPAETTPQQTGAPALQARLSPLLATCLAQALRNVQAATAAALPGSAPCLLPALIEYNLFDRSTCGRVGRGGERESVRLRNLHIALRDPAADRTRSASGVELLPACQCNDGEVIRFPVQGRGHGGEGGSAKPNAGASLCTVIRRQVPLCSMGLLPSKRV